MTTPEPGTETSRDPAARRFEGRVALVTGGAGGQGFATALTLARGGADVVLADLADDATDDLLAQVGEHGGRAAFQRMDVHRVDDVDRAVRATVETMGRLDLLAHCAGVVGSGAVADLSEEEWDRVVDVNLRGTFLVNRAAVRQMLKQGSGGAIVNVSSGLALVPAPGRGAYAASKAGMIAFASALAAEVGREGIRVNTVAPWVVRTPMVVGRVPDEQLNRYAQATTAIGRLAEAQEVADVICFLLSDEASYVSGVVLPVNGGAPIVGA